MAGKNLEHIPPRKQIIEQIASITQEVLVAFSGGKDSTALMIEIMPYFKTVVPYHLQLIPGLRLVEEVLCYYEDFFKVPIYRIVHPSTYTMWANASFMTQAQEKIVDATTIPKFTAPEIQAIVAQDHGLNPNRVFTARGNRVMDNLTRRSSIIKHGPINMTARVFDGIWDMTKAEMLDLFKRHHVKLSSHYMMFGRSFDGLHETYMGPIREFYPDDYEKIRRMFPLVGVTRFRSSLPFHGNEYNQQTGLLEGQQEYIDRAESGALTPEEYQIYLQWRENVTAQATRRTE